MGGDYVRYKVVREMSNGDTFCVSDKLKGDTFQSEKEAIEWADIHKTLYPGQKLKVVAIS